jgi:hypothetical protein
MKNVIGEIRNLKNEDPNTIVTEQYLTQTMGLSRNWIAKHASACGCFARNPRRFFLQKVLSHLYALAEKAQLKAGARLMQSTAQRQVVSNMFDTVVKKQKLAKIKRGPLDDFDKYFNEFEKKGGE